MKRISIVILLFVLTACTANLGNIPWDLDVKNWVPEKRASFFMKSWTAEKANYDAMNAIENKSESLVKALKIKYEVLEKSRVPVRTYATIVKNKGVPPDDMEDAIIKWLRSMQQQYLYQ